MTLDVGVLMDPIGAVKLRKDSTLAMLLEAQRRGHRLWYATQRDLMLDGGEPYGRLAPLVVRDDPASWFELGPAAAMPLARCDVFLARKDPPFDSQFLYDTLVLEQASARGCRVVNAPQALRDANEKLFALLFPQCIPETRVARDAALLREFVESVGEVVLKPLDGMAGRSIFRTHRGDPNLNVILETLTRDGAELAMAQRYVHQITDGDKRILVIDGEPVPYCLARIPQGDDFRGNLARGGKGVGRPLSERDRWIVAQVAPELVRRGIVFAGLDVIGDWLTEINVTSPTGIRELDAQFGLNIAGMLFDAIERMPKAAHASPPS
ncbi:MAG TPA: glutathione synthase [Candidatus Saccharimonadia bacterium]|nr:glutathione synthase [Candidatus Saccharimonadia bacterium]